jgi:GTP cyclohydrolase I
MGCDSPHSASWYTHDTNEESQVSTTQDEFVTQHATDVHQILSDLEAWHRTPEDHRADTPQRFLKMLWQLTQREEFNFTTFPAKSDEMIVLGPIPFYTMCAHHTAPFFGNAFIGYVPNGSIAGLSKFARAVKYLAKGFWVQEELTTEIATYLERKLYPRGIAVVVQAEHLCMAMRGVQQPGVITTTSSMRGVFADHDRTAKAEFMQFIERSMR